MELRRRLTCCVSSSSLSLAHRVLTARCVSPEVSELVGVRLREASTGAPCGLAFGEDEKLCVFDEEGQVVIHDDNNSSLTTFKAHKSSIYDVSWPHRNTLLTASADRSVRVWDLNGNLSIPLFQSTSHSESVKVLHHHPSDSNVFASGHEPTCNTVSSQPLLLTAGGWQGEHTSSKDDSIHIIDRRERRSLVNVLRQVHLASSYSLSAAKGVTGLRFLSDKELLSCGSSDGRLKIWDLRRAHINYKGASRPTHIFKHPGTSSRQGFASLVINKNATLAFVSCLDSNVYRFNLRIGHGARNSRSEACQRPDLAFEGAYINDFFVRLALSPDEDYLISGVSGAETDCPIWNCSTKYVLREAEEKRARVDTEVFVIRPVAKLITSSDVSSLAWSRRNGTIATYEETHDLILKWTPKWLLKAGEDTSEGSVQVLSKPLKKNSTTQFLSTPRIYRQRDDWLMSKERHPFTPIEVNVFNAVSPQKLRSPKKRLQIRQVKTPTDHMPSYMRDKRAIRNVEGNSNKSEFETPPKRPRTLNWLESLSLSKRKSCDQASTESKSMKQRRSNESGKRVKIRK